MLCSCGVQEKVKIEETQSTPELAEIVQETEQEKYYRMAKEKHIPENFMLMNAMEAKQMYILP